MNRGIKIEMGINKHMSKKSSIIYKPFIYLKILITILKITIYLIKFLMYSLMLMFNTCLKTIIGFHINIINMLDSIVPTITPVNP